MEQTEIVSLGLFYRGWLMTIKTLRKKLYNELNVGQAINNQELFNSLDLTERYLVDNIHKLVQA